MSKATEDISWQKHSTKNPFFEAEAPIEVQLHDGSTEVVGFPRSAANKKKYKDDAAKWRYIPSALWAGRDE